MIGIANQKVEPLPCSLDRLISPCISATKPLHILKPNPVPPNCLAVDASACENALKIPACSLFVRPIPVSLIAIFKLSVFSSKLSSSITRMIISPCSVNLIALLIKLVMICFRRSESPKIVRGASS